MEILEFLREVLKGIVRAVNAHIFKRTVLEKEKTTLRRQKVKGGSRKQR
ncbi:hypothetical protein [Lederbergia ruris]